MNVNELRNELKARNINSKGLKSQLVARLTKALKAEAAEKSDDVEDGDKKDETMEAEILESSVHEEKKAEVSMKLFISRKVKMRSYKLESKFKLTSFVFNIQILKAKA